MRQASRVPPEARSLSGVSLSCGEAFPRGEELHKGEPSFPTRGGVSEAPCRSERPRHIHDLPEVAWWAPRSPGPSLTRKRKESWCASSSLPSKSAAAIAAAAMPKRKKQDQQPPPPQQLLALSERDEPGDGEDERPTGPPSLLGPPPMANGKPGDPKSAFHRGPPGSRGRMIPPLLSLPPPPRGRGYIRGGLGPRASPYGRGWWGINTEPPFPGPGHGGPSRESFYKEARNPRRLRSWSLVKDTYPPKDSPQMMEDKSDRPICRHFSKKGHCRYEDHCAFYHPGVNGPPL
ncbi:proline-rich protein 3 isoform X1 [Mus pahari]|uniref:proline-rich protein 3 isoform X1 n=2 Tax=Mus pahari TaxID=10093 RepID=UPI000A3062B9|nr:proline-rich protein 3 isoform X1 [Mus pahari]